MLEKHSENNQRLQAPKVNSNLHVKMPEEKPNHAALTVLDTLGNLPAIGEKTGEEILHAYSPILKHVLSISREKLEGVFWGLAIGDALGLPVETMHREEIKRRFGRVESYLSPDHNRWFRGHGCQPGTYSDDTQLSLAIAEALSRANKFNIDVIKQEHIRAYDESTLGWGGSTRRGIERLKAGDLWFTAGKVSGPDEGKGNGIAMKVSPLAIYLAVSASGVDQAINMVADLASLTHHTSIAVSSGLAQCFGLLYCLASNPEEFSRETFLDYATFGSALGETIYSSSLNEDRLTQRLHSLREMSGLEKSGESALFGGGNCYVYNSLPFSYYYFLRNQNTVQCLFDVITEGGDTDTNGSIVGALLGALHGKNIFPEALRLGLVGKEKIWSTVERFWESLT